MLSESFSRLHILCVHRWYLHILCVQCKYLRLSTLETTCSCGMLMLMLMLNELQVGDWSLRDAALPLGLPVVCVCVCVCMYVCLCVPGAGT